MIIYSVQVILGDRFEDLLIKARNEVEALRKAEKATTLKSRWARFVI